MAINKRDIEACRIRKKSKKESTISARSKSTNTALTRPSKQGKPLQSQVTKSKSRKDGELDLISQQQNAPLKKNKHPQIAKAAQEKLIDLESPQSLSYPPTDLMSKDEALDLIKTFRKSSKSLMNTCYQFAVRKGFEVLGYKSFKEGIEKKNLGIEYPYAHRLKTAGEIHMIVCPDIPIGNIAEGVLRVLQPYSDEDKKQIWNKAIKKCSDVKKIKKPILENIIAEGGFEKKSVKKNVVNHEISPKLVKELKKVSFDLIKEHSTTKKGEKPVSKSHFNKTLHLIFNEVRNDISERYATLYGD